MSARKILIVDDDEGIRESLKLILSDNYDLILAESGQQCLDVLDHADDIGLVLMDIKMPKMDGLDVLKKLREKKSNMKVVIVTGYKSVDTAQEAVRLGALGYILKPFKPEHILSTVKNKMGSDS